MTTLDPNASVLDQLVGNDKKFSDAESLAKGKLEADSFIERLKEEKRLLEQEALRLSSENTRLKAKTSIINQLNDQDESDNDSNDDSTNVREPPQNKGLSAVDVVKMISEEKNKDRQKANKMEVDSTLNRLLGTEAVNFVKAKAAELGTSTEELQTLAVSNPRLFYATLGINPSAKTGTNALYQPSTVMQATSSPVRNKAFYDAKQKELGTLKFVMDKNLQIQLHKDMQALGDRWDA
jgi:hypothetical protein